MHMLSFSQALAPFVTQCVGIDISENMVGVFNARAENQVNPYPFMTRHTRRWLLIGHPAPLSCWEFSEHVFGD
jgi:hypothetical protein